MSRNAKLWELISLFDINDVKAHSTCPCPLGFPANALGDSGIQKRFECFSRWNCRKEVVSLLRGHLLGNRSRSVLWVDTVAFININTSSRSRLPARLSALRQRCFFVCTPCVCAHLRIIRRELALRVWKPMEVRKYRPNALGSLETRGWRYPEGNLLELQYRDLDRIVHRLECICRLSPKIRSWHRAPW